MSDTLTLQSPEQIEAFKAHLESVNEICGAIAEVGVYQGGTLEIICKWNENHHRRVYGFDTFEGLPQSDHEAHPCGFFGEVIYSDVEKRFMSQAHLVKGIFPQSAIPYAWDEFALAHIDVDLGESTTEALKWFWPKMVAQGRVIIHDYEWPNCPKVKEAVDSFAKLQGVPVHLSAPYQVYLIKL